MRLPDDLALIHQPVRLRVMGLLYKRRDASYVDVRDRLGLTDGNLATHARRLEDAGYVASRRALAGDRFEVRYRITTEGSAAFRRYVAAMRRFLDDAGSDEAQAGSDGSSQPSVGAGL